MPSSLTSPHTSQIPPDAASLHSNEADDERSPSVRSVEDPIMDGLDHGAKPSYPGEDVRMTSSKELWGWYSYGWAAEVFVVCGIGSFIPMTLEQLAREQGVLYTDRTTPCKSGIDTAPPDLNNTVISRAPRHHDRSSQCVINFLGTEINTASFAMYTFSISVFLQALVIISMSGAADHGRYRKSLLLGFAVVGAIATMLFLPVTSNVYALGAFFAIIANISFGASFVLLNSFLPLLVRHHPQVRAPLIVSELEINGNTVVQEERFVDDEGNNQELADSTSALLPHDSPSEATTAHIIKIPSPASLELQLSTKISSNGIGIGYIAAVIVQILSVVIIQMTGGSTFSLRVVLFFVGAWWFMFTLPSAVWLRPRPGPPLKTGGATSKRTWIAYMGFAWKSLGRTIVRARRLKDMLLFLAAWFLLSDGIATVSGTAVLFAKTTLGMKPAALALINVVVMISGVFGAFSWSRFSRFMGLKPTGTILACIVVFEMIPIYALLGYIPALQEFGAFGLQQPWEMYPLGAVYGIVLGGLSSYCRSLFGELIPPGFEASFYALYAITDKGSSVFGPAIVGAITDKTGDIRPAFWFLAVLIGLPFPLMWFVDVGRGRDKAFEVSTEIQGQRVQHLDDEDDE